jgi:hypothetical protein
VGDEGWFGKTANKEILNYCFAKLRL